MLTRLKLKRGEGQLVRAQDNPQPRRARVPLSPPSISSSLALESATDITSREEEVHEEIDPKEEERIFRKAFLDMTEMVRILYQERNDRIAGEGSRNQREEGDSSGGKKDNDNSKKGNGGNGDPPSPSSSSSSTSSSSTSVNQSHKTKTIVKAPLLKLDVNFELPMFNGDVNAEKLDNWIRQLEVYLRTVSYTHLTLPTIYSV